MSILFTLLMKFLILPFLLLVIPIVAFCAWIISMDNDDSQNLPTEKEGE